MSKLPLVDVHLQLKETDAVLPCPFCGSTNLELANTWTPSYWVECLDCGACGTGKAFEPYSEMESHIQSKQYALERWNTRAVGRGEQR